MIVVEFPNRETLDRCFASAEYWAVAGLRMQSVEASAVIVEGDGAADWENRKQATER